MTYFVDTIASCRCTLPSPRRADSADAATARRASTVLGPKSSSSVFGRQPPSYRTEPTDPHTPHPNVDAAEVPRDSATAPGALRAPVRDVGIVVPWDADAAGRQGVAEPGDGPSSFDESSSLEAVTRQRVLATSTLTAALMGAAAPVLRAAAETQGEAWHGFSAEAIRAVASVPEGGVTPEHWAVAIIVAGAVTAARAAAAIVAPRYAAATRQSLAQALDPLEGLSDLALVACVPALGEELFFRGGLVPLVSPDWRGVAIAAVVFGSLHVSGGRGPWPALFATGAGAAYGASMLATSDVAVPVVAHALANLASAWAYKIGLWDAACGRDDDGLT